MLGNICISKAHHIVTGGAAARDMTTACGLRRGDEDRDQPMHYALLRGHEREWLLCSACAKADPDTVRRHLAAYPGE